MTEIRTALQSRVNPRSLGVGRAWGFAAGIREAVAVFSLAACEAETPAGVEALCERFGGRECAGREGVCELNLQPYDDESGREARVGARKAKLEYVVVATN